MRLHSSFLPFTLFFLALCGPTLTQNTLSFFQGLQAASQALRLAKSAAENNGSIVSTHPILQEMMKLSPEQIQAVLLQFVKGLTDGRAGDAESGGHVESVRAMLQAGNGSAVSEMCLNHTVAAIVGLVEQQSWALQMLDAMGKPSAGIKDGNLVWPGSYDQCYGVHASLTKYYKADFGGQYCTAFVPLPQNNMIFVLVQAALGVCVPDSCSAMDLTSLAQYALSSLNATQNLQVHVACSQPDRALDAKAIAAIVILSFLLLFLVVGTVLDVLIVQLPRWQVVDTKDHGQGEEHAPLLPCSDNSMTVPPRFDTVTKVFLAFSVYTNGSKLLSTSQAPGSLTCIHGVRFLSMTWVLLGHCLIFPFSLGASANMIPYLTKATKRWSFQAICNALVSVDTFFLISGLLVTYLSLKEMKKKGGKINWFLFYFHRFWRLTPPYMLVIMVYVCVTPYWGSGPLWPERLADRDNCNTAWWANLLYINNLVDTKELCLAQSWYLANDMQFYILSPLIFVPFYFSPLLGAVSSGVFLLVTAIVPGILTMRDNYPPSVLPGQVQGGEDNASDFIEYFYIKPYNRMGPYIVGMLAGYFLYRTNCKLRVNKVVNLSLWAIATGCALAVLYGLYDASNGHPVTLSVSALYNAVNRQVWALCVAWVIVACVTGNGGFVNTILSWPALVPLSRLTYCVYLLHIMIIELVLLNSGSVFFVNDINLVMLFLGIMMLSYMAAVITSLAFEAPMMGLEKVVFHRHLRSRDDKASK